MTDKHLYLLCSGGKEQDRRKIIIQSTMKAALIRTGSVPVQHSPSKFFIGDHDSVTGILFSGKKSTWHLEIKEKKKVNVSSIRRTRSETDVINSVFKSPCKLLKSGSRSFPARIIEEEEDDEEEEEGGGPLILKKKDLNLDTIGANPYIWRESSGVLEEEEVDLSGGGIGKGKNVGGGNGGDSGGDSDQRNMCDYYESLLKSNPGNSLILRNYGKYLHEVKGDFVKAEECYSRAILASPGDGELLSMYGKLIWESYRDEERAESYFDQAVQAAPDDCYVMGSYANFLWSAEEDEDEEEDISKVKLRSPPTMVEAC